MTLSRRDEFAARAMAAFIRNGGADSFSELSKGSVKVADTLIAELDRTAPKSEREEIEDDGREIVCTYEPPDSILVECFGNEIEITTRVGLSRPSIIITTSDARLFALRIMRAADEAEKAGK